MPSTLGFLTMPQPPGCCSCCRCMVAERLRSCTCSSNSSEACTWRSASASACRASRKRRRRSNAVVFKLALCLFWRKTGGWDGLGRRKGESWVEDDCVTSEKGSVQTHRTSELWLILLAFRVNEVLAGVKTRAIKTDREEQREGGRESVWESFSHMATIGSVEEKPVCLTMIHVVPETECTPQTECTQQELLHRLQ